MRAPSVTVFVRKQGETYFASTYSHDAVSKESAAKAAHRASALHMSIGTDRIGLIPADMAGHEFIGFVKEPPKIGSRFCDRTALVAFWFGTVLMAYLVGNGSISFS